MAGEYTRVSMSTLRFSTLFTKEEDGAAPTSLFSEGSPVCLMLETSLWYPLPVLPTPAETCAAPHLLTLFAACAEPINGNHCNKDIHNSNDHETITEHVRWAVRSWWRCDVHHELGLNAVSRPKNGGICRRLHAPSPRTNVRRKVTGWRQRGASCKNTCML